SPINAAPPAHYAPPRNPPLVPSALMIPPLITVGSRPPASSSEATREVVVVLPCVPAIATQLLSRINSASISARRTTGRRLARAATSSGLSRLIADETTTTSAPSILSAL